MFIKKIKAFRVIDSRSFPTIKTYVYTDSKVGYSIVPSGTSSGENEAYELRDNSKGYNGKDVSIAISNINNIISKELTGEFIFDQEGIDNKLKKLDGTKNKSRLGANAILSVSLAVSRVAANELNIPLYKYISRLNKRKSKYFFPKPILNFINGGDHAGNDLEFQEFQIIPSFNDFDKNMKASIEIYLKLKENLKNKVSKNSINVGYEGGFAPNFNDNKLALDYLYDSIKDLGYKKKVSIGLDCAANSFYNKRSKKYTINSKKYDYKQLTNYYKDIIKEYNISSIEDPFYEKDYNAWKYFYKNLNSKINIIGDDLLVTNKDLIKKAIKNKYCNSLLLKVNQIGTLTESIDAFNFSKKNNWDVIVSHRSGDSEDSYIADLAYGLGSDFTKFGATSRSERTSKYNRLLEIKHL